MNKPYYLEWKWKGMRPSSTRFKTFNQAYDEGRNCLIKPKRPNSDRDYLIVGSVRPYGKKEIFHPIKKWTPKTGWRNA